MSNFDVTQRLMSVSTVYDIAKRGSGTVDMTAYGTFMAASQEFRLVQGTEGKELATLKGNFGKTKFQVIGEGEKELASLEFPSVAIKKTLKLNIGGKEYSADAGVFSGTFRCADAQGNVALEIKKEGGLSDKFSVNITDGIAPEVGLLAAVAIHCRFFALV